jgi:Fungal Zn(2)-Cys(6) binuclear cluster domain
MNASQSNTATATATSAAAEKPRKRRAACDQCHSAKVKCPGREKPCERCAQNSMPCHYSFAARMGKPPGSKNKKTLERMQAAAAAAAAAPNGRGSDGSRESLRPNNVCASAPEPAAGGDGRPQQPPSDGGDGSGSGSIASPRIIPNFSLVDVENLLGNGDATDADADMNFDIPTELNNSSIMTPNPFDYTNAALDDSWSVSSLSPAVKEFAWLTFLPTFSFQAYRFPQPTLTRTSIFQV